LVANPENVKLPKVKADRLSAITVVTKKSEFFYLASYFRAVIKSRSTEKYEISTNTDVSI
jgi:hypothetical protein